MATDYLPGAYDIPAHMAGDTFNGLLINSIEIDDASPTTALTGVRFQLRGHSPDNPEVAYSADANSNGISILDTGTWNFLIEPFKLDIPPCTYYYDVETADDGNNTRTYLSGQFSVEKDITR